MRKRLGLCLINKFEKKLEIPPSQRPNSASVLCGTYITHCNRRWRCLAKIRSYPKLGQIPTSVIDQHIPNIVILNMSRANSKLHIDWCDLPIHVYTSRDHATSMLGHGPWAIVQDTISSLLFTFIPG